MNINSIVTIIDLNFQDQKDGIAAFIVDAPEGPILIETGPHSTFDLLCDKIRIAGYQPEEIKHILITHIHLDHAGAAWAFAESGATIYLHPLGYRHMHDPEKLLASAKQIYKEKMDTLWGTLKPIPAEQLVVVEDDEEIKLNGLNFRALHTPGHAKHHIAWQLDTMLFTGDVAGVSINGGPVIPPCPPPDINIEHWEDSIDKLLNIPEIDTYYLTHFGKVTDIAAHMYSLKQTIKLYADFILPYYKKGMRADECMPDFKLFAKKHLIENGMSQDDAEAYEAANPSYMSVAGLLRYWHKKLAV